MTNFLIEIKETDNLTTFVDDNSNIKYGTIEQMEDIINSTPNITWNPIGSESFLTKFNMLTKG